MDSPYNTPNDVQNKLNFFARCRRNYIMQNDQLTYKEKQLPLYQLNKIRRKIGQPSSKMRKNKLLDIQPKKEHSVYLSTNVGKIRTNDAIYNAIENVSQNKIDISRIQETHNESTDIIIIKDYKLFPGGQCE